MNRLKTWIAALALALMLPGAGLLAAESDAAIGGYCPVAYVKMGKAVKGDLRWTSVRDGQTFQFSAAQAKDLYEKSPDQFNVAYKGYCATGVAMGKKIASNPEVFSVHKGVTYLFSSADAKMMFDKDPEMTIAKADKAWPSAK